MVPQDLLWRHTVGQNVECRFSRILRDETNVRTQVSIPDDWKYPLIAVGHGAFQPRGDKYVISEHIEQSP